MCRNVSAAETMALASIEPEGMAPASAITDWTRPVLAGHLKLLQAVHRGVAPGDINQLTIFLSGSKTGTSHVLRL